MGESKKGVTMEEIDLVIKEVQRVKNTTHKESWKAFERRVASDFKTTRTPLSGMVKTITNSDTLHPDLYIECKYRGKEFTFFEEFMQIRDRMGIPPIFHIHPKGRHLLYLMYVEDFFRFINEPDLRAYKCRRDKYKAVSTLFEETIERSQLEDKLPIIAIKLKGAKGYLIGFSPRDRVLIKNVIQNGARGISLRAKSGSGKQTNTN